MNEQDREVEQEIIEPHQHPGRRLGQQPERSLVVEQNTVALLNKSEIDQQITTAHAYPRSIKAFRDEAMAMVTLDESIARECIYALPRDGKIIEGPSARFAEIIQSAWGNCRAGARVVSESADFITAQGVFHDLEKNAAITYEVQRRITNKNGQRFKVDMIGVTGNAACSIALRNAILKGVPKAFWNDMYLAARKVIMGDFKTLANKRANALQAFAAYGVKEAEIFQLLGVKGVEDIAPEHLVTLSGVLTAIKDGDTTVEEAFSRKPPAPPSAPPAPAAPSPAAAAPQPKPKAAPKRQPGTPRSTGAYKDMARQEPVETIDPETGEVMEPEETAQFDPDKFLDGLEAALAVCQDQDTLEEVWNAEAQPWIEKGIVFPPDREKAEKAYERHTKRLGG